MNIYFRNTHQRAFGTYPLIGDETRAAILAAAEVGYHAFDTVQTYGNEAENTMSTKSGLLPGELRLHGLHPVERRHGPDREADA